MAHYVSSLVALVRDSLTAIEWLILSKLLLTFDDTHFDILMDISWRALMWDRKMHLICAQSIFFRPPYHIIFHCSFLGPWPTGHLPLPWNQDISVAHTISPSIWNGWPAVLLQLFSLARLSLPKSWIKLKLQCSSSPLWVTSEFLFSLSVGYETERHWYYGSLGYL